MGIDNKTGQDISISFQHHLVHDKQLFTVGLYETALAAGADIVLAIQCTSSTEFHMVYSVEAGADAEVNFYSSVTAATTAAITPRNHHRGGTDTTTTKFYESATITAGTILFSTFLPGGTSPVSALGGVGGRETELLLEDLTFGIKVTNKGSGSEDVNILVEGYELPV